MHRPQFTIHFIGGEVDKYIMSLICPRVGEEVNLDSIDYLVKRVVFFASPPNLIDQVTVWLKSNHGR